MSSAVDERGRKKIIGSHTCTHTHNQRNHFKAPDPRMRFDRKRLFFLGKPGKKCSCFALARLIISRAEPLCDATIWYLPPGCPSVPPGDFLLHVPSQKELQLSEIRCLAEKGRLHMDDDGVLRHVRKKKRPPAPACSDKPGGRGMLDDDPTRIYASRPIRPWIMHVHAIFKCAATVLPTTPV